MYSLTEMMYILFFLVALALILKVTLTMDIPPYEFGPYHAYQYAQVECYLYSSIHPILAEERENYIRYFNQSIKVLRKHERPC